MMVIMKLWDPHLRITKIKDCKMYVFSVSVFGHKEIFFFFGSSIYVYYIPIYMFVAKYAKSHEHFCDLPFGGTYHFIVVMHAFLQKKNDLQSVILFALITVLMKFM